MNRSEYLKSVNDMIYLIYSIINNKIPDKNKIDNMNLENIYKAAENHMLTAITAMALETAGVKNHTFTQAKGKAFRKNAALDVEREALFSYLDSEGIWYMPLKGAIFKEFYPSYGMRQMSDNDILFDSKYRAKVKKYFELHGYKVEEYNKGNHDVYIKLPVINFEMHIELFNNKFNAPEIIEYYKNVKDILIKDGSGFGYHFTNEDFYIYMIAHEFKHFSKGGTGLRSILDTYVFMKKFENSLDIKYIENMLKKFGISDFEKSIREVAADLFGKNQLDIKNNEMFEYIAFSGVHGTTSNIVINKIKALDNDVMYGKFKYIWSRIFLTPAQIKESYPYFYRHKILLPLLPFHRLKRLLTTSYKRINGEVKTLIKYK